MDFARLYSVDSILVSPGGVNFYSPKQREKLADNAGLKTQDHYYLLGRVMLSIFVKN